MVATPPSTVSDLPPAHLLRCRGGVTQLFQNLVRNALKYRGRKPPVVDVAGWRRERIVRVRVTDNGVGFRDEEKERIFDVFTRLRPDEGESGFGIGLATCRRIVEDHGGRIWAESAPGQGAKFFFELPADD